MVPFSGTRAGIAYYDTTVVYNISWPLSLVFVNIFLSDWLTDWLMPCLALPRGLFTTEKRFRELQTPAHLRIYGIVWIMDAHAAEPLRTHETAAVLLAVYTTGPPERIYFFLFSKLDQFLHTQEVKRSNSSIMLYVYDMVDSSADRRFFTSGAFIKRKEKGSI